MNRGRMPFLTHVEREAVNLTKSCNAVSVLHAVQARIVRRVAPKRALALIAELAPLVHSFGQGDRCRAPVAIPHLSTNAAIEGEFR